MSEEEYSEEEVEVEEDTEEVSPTVKTPEAKRAPVSLSRDAVDAAGEDNLTEAEKAMQAAKKRNETDDSAKLQDYEDRRRVEREREEEELRMLKEKQEQRRIQREEEEREMEERRREAEERRKAEEEERKVRIEADRKKKEEEKKRRQQSMMGVGFTTPAGGRNFTLPDKKKDNTGDKFGNIVQAKQEMGMTKDQREEAKKAFIAQVLKNIGELGSLGGSELKGKMKEMHHRICKLEAEKYDMEKRVQTQEYDLKELNERQRQMNRNKLKSKGMDPEAGGNSRHPAKIAVASKYDRQIDRRNFKERRAMYDKKHAYPCFPNVPPPPTILEFKLMDPTSPKPDGDEEEEEEEEEE